MSLDEFGDIDACYGHGCWRKTRCLRYKVGEAHKEHQRWLPIVPIQPNGSCLAFANIKALENPDDDPGPRAA